MTAISLAPSGAAGEAALWRLVRAGMLIRLCLAVVLHFAVNESTFAPDQAVYHQGGAALARYWEGSTPEVPWIFRQVGRTGYFYVVGALYLAFGDYALIPKLVNAIVGTLCIGLVFGVARRTTGSAAAALRTARFVTFFPSLVLWSVLNIRDVWVAMFILVIGLETMRLQERVNVRSVVLAGSAVLALMQFRDYLFFAVVVPVLASFLIRSRGNLARNAVLGVVLAGLAVYVDTSVGSRRTVRSIDLETLSQLRAGTAVGDSAFDATADVSTPGRALAFLPKGLAYFLLAPFPWAIGNLRQLFTLPEMLFFYSLVPAMMRGVAHLVRHRLRDSVMILSITGAITLGYALGQGNQGTAYRHRAQVLPFYLAFGALGLEVRRVRGQRPAPAVGGRSGASEFHRRAP